MDTATIGVDGMAKKKTAAAAKPHGTMIRVSEEFAAALSNATSIEKMSAAEFSDAYLLPVVRKRYKDAVLKEAKRLEGGGDK
jgi:hypothetical protein